MSGFERHIRERVAGIALDADGVAQALVRERAAELRHIAGCLREQAPKVPAFESLIAHLEGRATKLDQIANRWGAAR